MLKINNLSVSKNGQTLLDEINLQINAGDFLLLLGKNGAGKSTLMKSILGLERNITPGSIISKNAGITQLDFSYMPERDTIRDDTIVGHLLSAFLTANKINSKCASPILIDELIETLNLKLFKKRRYGSLSKGEKKKVLFAVSLFTDYNILVLDEPLEGFDVTMKDSIMRLLNQSRKFSKKPKAVVISSHELDPVLDHINKVAHLKSGRLVDVHNATGRSSELLESLKKQIAI